MTVSGLPVFEPDWALPAGIRALQTECGVGESPYGSLNLGDHVGQSPDQVSSNRRRICDAISAAPVWLRQVHGTCVYHIQDRAVVPPPEADAAMTRLPGMACAIMTADCLPVLVADRHGRLVGAAHAGWRGLAAGVIQQLITLMCTIPGVAPGDLMVWLGPAIGPAAFEVGHDVVDAFTRLDTHNGRHFMPHPDVAGKFLADLPGLAHDILRHQGVDNITLSGLCTVSLSDRFYSYRRNAVTGRMASLIWLE